MQRVAAQRLAMAADPEVAECDPSSDPKVLVVYRVRFSFVAAGVIPGPVGAAVGAAAAAGRGPEVESAHAGLRLWVRCPLGGGSW